MSIARNREQTLITAMADAFASTGAYGGQAFAADAELFTLAPAAEARELAVTTDHVSAADDLLSTPSPEAFGAWAAAVTLSDLAAVGAEPRAVVIALSCPRDTSEADAAAFAHGVGETCASVGAQVLGGDTTLGPPWSATVTAIGCVPRGMALKRTGARPGDQLYASGRLGGNNARAYALATGRRPIAFSVPIRTRFGVMLRGIASACTDSSDGLMGALDNLLAPGLGCIVEDDDRIYVEEGARLLQRHGMPRAALLCGLAGEYELVFTVPDHARAALSEKAAEAGVELIALGHIVEGNGVRIEERRCVRSVAAHDVVALADGQVSPSRYLGCVLGHLLQNTRLRSA